MKRLLALSVLVGCIPIAKSVAIASELEQAARDGYGVLETTEVQGEFTGCDFGRHIPLADGLIFVCSGYSYHYAYSPEVLILVSVRQKGLYRVLIDDDQYDGELLKR